MTFRKKIWQLFDEGLTVSQVRERLGCGSSTVSDAARVYRARGGTIAGRYRRFGRKPGPKVKDGPDDFHFWACDPYKCRGCGAVLRLRPCVGCFSSVDRWRAANR